MGISQRLCQIKDRDFGGKQLTMALDWDLNQSTLSRWLARDRIPEAIWYDFLAEKLGTTVEDVHRLCMAERNGVELGTSARKVAIA